MKWIFGALVLLFAACELLTDDTPETTTAAGQSALRQPVQPQINRNEVKAKLHRVRTALHQYNVESGEVPAGFDEVIQFGLLQSGDVIDPWGRSFAFRSEQKPSTNPFTEEYEIFVYSTGPDGVRDNLDDIYL